MMTKPDNKASMNNESDFLSHPRSLKSMKLWKNISSDQWNDPNWQRKNSIRNVEDLSEIIILSKNKKEKISEVILKLRSEGKEPLRITPYYASLIQEDPFNPVFFGERSTNRLDPIFWQSVPTPANLLFPNAGTEGAMNEGSRSYGAAYQRYPNRVALFVAENTSCASYCVHCQRAKSLDSKTAVTSTEIRKGLFYIGYNKNIDEVLVTGGDALMINEAKLKFILEELSRIPHLRSIRIATRVPVVLPMGVTSRLLKLIKQSANKYNKGVDKYVYFMTHINHYQEITIDLYNAVKRIREHGFTIRNQTVLLNHVNDDYKILAETFRRMLWIGVHPYYLLQCHREKGIVHFITSIQEGKIIMKHLQGWISGITIPRYAANIEGGGGKVVLMPSGHDTLNLKVTIEDRISESYASVNTWDDRKISKYEALGKATKQEFDEAVEIMDKFIGRKGVFVPKIIIVDEQNHHLQTANRSTLVVPDKKHKAKLLEYKIFNNGLPITNPSEIAGVLDEEFRKSMLFK